jgi:hypothetical protein
MPLVRSFLLILAVGLFTPLLTPISALAWEFTERGDGGAFDEALAVSVGGHVFAAGRINDDIFTVKLHRQHGAAMWRYHPSNTVPGSESVHAVAFDPVGHPIVAGVTTEEDPAHRGRLTVIKIDKDTGVLHWITRVRAGSAMSVAVDAAGDVIAAGTLDNGAGVEGMGVVKLRGSDGVELWRAQPSGTEPGGQVRALALDSSGNAVVAGFLRNAPFRPDFAVVKLSGVDGTEQWRHQNPSHQFSGGDEAVGVAVDPNGDVVAVGTIRIFTGNSLPSKFAVVKLAGGAGSVLWRHDVDAGGTSSSDGFALALDPLGHVIAVGGIDGQSAVVKLAGADGSEVWRHVSDDGPRPASMDIDKRGDVVKASRNGVKKLSGATGTAMWPIENTAIQSLELARAVVFDEVGDVVVVGGGAGGFVVVKLRGSNGEGF